MSLTPHPQADTPHRKPGAAPDPQGVVEGFLGALARGDADTARALIADDIEYVNVGLAPIRGAARVERVIRLVERPAYGFDVVLHSISAHGPVVLTERTDLLVVGRVHGQFWVWGRFDVHDGRITLWRDSFDYLDVARGTVRGLLGAVVPRLRPTLPAPDQAPGR